MVGWIWDRLKIKAEEMDNLRSIVGIREIDKDGRSEKDMRWKNEIK